MFDEKDTLNRYKSGDKTAYNDIFKAYEPIINSTVAQYKGTGIPDDALNLEAKRIVMTSMKNFDPEKGNLTSHIQNNLKSMFRETNKANQVYIPDARAAMYRKYKDTRENMYTELKRDPTDYELADALKMGVSDIRKLSKETGATIVSDAGMIDVDDYDSPTYEPPKEFLESLRRNIDNPIDKKILDMSMNGKTPSSNQQIGDTLGMTEGAVRLRKSKLIQRIKDMN